MTSTALCKNFIREFIDKYPPIDTWTNWKFGLWLLGDFGSILEVNLECSVSRKRNFEASIFTAPAQHCCWVVTTFGNWTSEPTFCSSIPGRDKKSISKIKFSYGGCLPVESIVILSDQLQYQELNIDANTWAINYLLLLTIRLKFNYTSKLLFVVK